jgi:hypothetical protein
MIATNKQYSYLRVTMIWIDVHPVGENLSTHHTLSTLDLRMVLDHTYLVWSTYSTLSLVSTRSKQARTPKKSLGNQRQIDPVVILGHLIPPSLRQHWSRGEKVWSSGYTATRAYWAHNSSMWSVRSILAHMGNPSVVLNQHRRGLQPWRCHLPTSHSPPFSTDGPSLST